MTFIQRQISTMLARGDCSTIAEATVFPWRQRDARPSTILTMAEGKRQGKAILIANGASYSVQLPSDYSTSNRLHFALACNGTLKVTVASPELTSSPSTQLLYGASTARAIMVFQQRVTSMTLTAPSADVMVEYEMFELPDLDDEDSYRDGNRTIGHT